MTSVDSNHSSSNVLGGSDVGEGSFLPDNDDAVLLQQSHFISGAGIGLGRLALASGSSRSTACFVRGGSSYSMPTRSGGITTSRTR